MEKRKKELFMNLVGQSHFQLYCIFFVKKLKLFQLKLLSFKVKLLVFPSDKNSFLKE